MNKFRYLLLALPLAMMIGYGCSESKNRLSASREADSADSAAEEVMENEETVEASQMPAQSLALLEAYPDCIKEIKDNFVVMVSGDKLVYDDGKQKDFMGRLDDSDIEDMFYDVYSLPDPKPAFQFDPGRSRSEALFKAMYGSSAEEVRKKLVDVEWFGERVKFMSVNGAADSLRAVARELTGYPELRPYLKSSGTFYWRPVRGAKRMSAHSYGIAFDIGVDKSDYWLWKSGSNDENKPVEYANRIPREIVEIFQKHGFIWGGAWYHYDTMHFEFRPELLKYAAYAGR
ncbi:MAG: M15 family metallopeptidase [Bacteroides sp.]|nr:M15 family metallopeptidase [Bacteroides sp.]